MKHLNNQNMAVNYECMVAVEQLLSIQSEVTKYNGRTVTRIQNSFIGRFNDLRHSQHARSACADSSHRIHGTHCCPPILRDVSESRRDIPRHHLLGIPRLEHCDPINRPWYCDPINRPWYSTAHPSRSLLTSDSDGLVMRNA